MNATLTSCSLASWAGTATDGATSMTTAAPMARRRRQRSRDRRQMPGARANMSVRSRTASPSEGHRDFAVERPRNLGRRRVDQLRRELEMLAVEQVLADEGQFNAVHRTPAEPRVEREVRVDVALG